MSKEQKGYKINRYYMNTEKAMNIFRTYCEDLELGLADKPFKIIKDGDNEIKKEIPIDVTPDTFMMIHADLPEENLWATARKQIPYCYFINPEKGYILSFSEEQPIWYVGNQRLEKEEGEEEDHFDVQMRFKPYESCTKDIVVGSITIRVYALIAIIGASMGRTYVFVSREMEEKIKTYGLLCFGVGNSGKNDSDKGPKGLFITKKVKKGEKAPDPVEIIQYDEMLEVHHIQGHAFSDFEHLEILARWLHDYLKIYTANVSTKNELLNLLKKNPDCKKRLDNLANGRNYFIKDLSKTVDEHGDSNIYIHYMGINEYNAKQVTAKYYKYFAIIWVDKSIEDKKEIKDIRKLVNVAYTCDFVSQQFFYDTPSKFWIKFLCGSVGRFFECKERIDKDEEIRRKLIKIVKKNGHDGCWNYVVKPNKKYGECTFLVETDPNYQGQYSEEKGESYEEKDLFEP